MENNRLEESFKQAFDGAEFEPSDSVWKNVELDLEKASQSKVKRNLLLFQLLAAASAAFAFGISALYYLDSKQPVNDNQVTNQAVLQPKHNDSTRYAELTIDADKEKSTTSMRLTDKSITRKEKFKKSADLPISLQDQRISEGQDNYTEYKVHGMDLTAVLKTEKPALPKPLNQTPEFVEPDAGMILLARLKDEERKYEKEEKKRVIREKVWTSAGFGAGSYKPNISSSVNPLAAGRGTPDEVSGTSYSASVDVAGKISKRIILQGGVSYISHSADFTSMAVNQSSMESAKKASLNNFLPEQQANFVATNPYTVNSNMQYVSIPVQAGFLILDRNFAIQVNGGVSTNMFIKNTLIPENGDSQKVNEYPGTDSPYRSFSFSGLLGTEFSLKIADHYRVSLNPGMRYALNSTYKSKVEVDMMPVTYDVLLRFRYIFN